MLITLSPCLVAELSFTMLVNKLFSFVWISLTCMVCLINKADKLIIYLVYCFVFMFRL